MKLAIGPCVIILVFAVGAIWLSHYLWQPVNDLEAMKNLY